MRKDKTFLRGYSIVLHSFISYMFLAFVFVSFTNVVFPQFVAKCGWNNETLVSINSIGAIIGAVASVFIGQWVEKKGAKQVLIIGYIVGAVNLFLMSFANSIVVFTIHVIIAHLSVMCCCQMTTNNLIAHWFAKKKGAILGITTAGLPINNLVLAVLFTKFAAASGLTIALSFIAACMLVMGLASIPWVKNSPQEVGLTPDNLPIPENNNTGFVQKNYTFKQMLSKWVVWNVILVFGIMFMATIASVTYMVTFFMQNGFELTTAVMVMGYAAIGGVVGSVLFGFVDQKWGTKVANICYIALAIVTYAGMYFFHANSAIVIFFAIIAFGLNGAPGNLMPSYLISIFGPEYFNSTSKIVTPIVCLFRSVAYLFAAFFVTVFGGGMAYGVYIGLTVSMIICLVLAIVLKFKRVDLAQ